MAIVLRRLVAVLGLAIILLTSSSGAGEGSREEVQSASVATDGSQSAEVQRVTPSDVKAVEANWHVLSGGGGSGTAGTLRYSATIGQPIVGWTGTASQVVHAGFWQNFETGGCCEYRGNVDHQLSGGNPISVADLTYLIAMVFRGGPDAPCMEEADTNGDGTINVADMSYLIAYVFRGGPAPPPC